MTLLAKVTCVTTYPLRPPLNVWRLIYRTIILILKTRNFGHDFKTAEPLLHGQRVDGGVEFATKIIA